MIAVAHPYHRLLGDVREQVSIIVHNKIGTTKFTSVGLFDTAGDMVVGYRLQSVADTQNRRLPGKNFGIQRRRVLVILAAGPPRQNNTLRRLLTESGEFLVKGVNFAIDPELANSPGNQLGIL